MVAFVAFDFVRMRRNHLARDDAKKLHAWLSLNVLLAFLSVILETALENHFSRGLYIATYLLGLLSDALFFFVLMLAAGGLGTLRPELEERDWKRAVRLPSARVVAGLIVLITAGSSLLNTASGEPPPASASGSGLAGVTNPGLALLALLATILSLVALVALCTCTNSFHSSPGRNLSVLQLAICYQSVP